MRFIIMLATMILGNSSFAAVSASLELPLTFKENGKEVKKMTLAEMQKMTPSKEVEIFEPHEKVNKTYKAFSLPDVLKRVYGSAYKQRNLGLLAPAIRPLSGGW